MHQPTTEQPPAIPPRAVSEGDAANYLNLSVSALRKSRMNGFRENHLPPPPFVRVGRRILYLIDDLDRWLESNRVFGSSMAGGSNG